MLVDDNDDTVISDLDSPVILQIQIGFHHQLNKESEARYSQIQDELMTHIREKYGDILEGIETAYFELEVEAEQDQEISNLMNKVLH